LRARWPPSPSLLFFPRRRRRVTAPPSREAAPGASRSDAGNCVELVDRLGAVLLSVVEDLLAQMAQSNHYAAVSTATFYHDHS
jgi:hypothetical protein